MEHNPVNTAELVPPLVVPEVASARTFPLRRLITAGIAAVTLLPACTTSEGSSDHEVSQASKDMQELIGEIGAARINYDRDGDGSEYSDSELQAINSGIDDIGKARLAGDMFKDQKGQEDIRSIKDPQVRAIAKELVIISRNTDSLMYGEGLMSDSEIKPENLQAASGLLEGEFKPEELADVHDYVYQQIADCLDTYHLAGGNELGDMSSLESLLGKLPKEKVEALDSVAYGYALYAMYLYDEDGINYATTIANTYPFSSKDMASELLDRIELARTVVEQEGSTYYLSDVIRGLLEEYRQLEGEYDLRYHNPTALYLKISKRLRKESDRLQDKLDKLEGDLNVKLQARIIEMLGGDLDLDMPFAFAKPSTQYKNGDSISAESLGDVETAKVEVGLTDEDSNRDVYDQLAEVRVKNGQLIFESTSDMPEELADMMKAALYDNKALISAAVHNGEIPAIRFVVDVFQGPYYDSYTGELIFAIDKSDGISYDDLRTVLVHEAIHALTNLSNVEGFGVTREQQDSFLRACNVMQEDLLEQTSEGLDDMAYALEGIKADYPEPAVIDALIGVVNSGDRIEVDQYHDDDQLLGADDCTNSLGGYTLNDLLKHSDNPNLGKNSGLELYRWLEDHPTNPKAVMILVSLDDILRVKSVYGRLEEAHRVEAGYDTSSYGHTEDNINELIASTMSFAIADTKLFIRTLKRMSEDDSRAVITVFRNSIDIIVKRNPELRGYLSSLEGKILSEVNR